MRKAFFLTGLSGTVEFEADPDDDYPVRCAEIIISDKYGESRITRQSTNFERDLFRFLEPVLLKCFEDSFQPFWDARANKEACQYRGHRRRA